MKSQMMPDAAPSDTAKQLQKLRFEILSSPSNQELWAGLEKEIRQGCSTELREFRNLIRNVINELTLTQLSRKRTLNQNIDSSEPVSLEDIPWVHDASVNDTEELPFPPLDQFDYDCSYLTPFIHNLYGRERVHDGWMRWVGPDPLLEINLPFVTGNAMWEFKVIITSFFKDEDASSLTFSVNGKTLPLEWLEGTSYRSMVEGSLLDQAHEIPGSHGFCNLILAIANSHEPDGIDQRKLAFAIQRISLQPQEVIP